jgi:S-ribosylhomocysteine lyase
MEKIKSFTVDHFKLEPGIYESRRDHVGDQAIITYDLRITKPNGEPVLNTAEVHTIEHLGATFLRNHPTYKDSIIYFGPMGCRTGFYLLICGELPHDELFILIYDLFLFIANFEGVVPGANEADCGNGLDHNLPMAKWAARKYLASLLMVKGQPFAY